MSYIDKIKKIQNEINQISVNSNLIIVTKNQDLNVINTLVDAGYNHFGENRIQEAKNKWSDYLKVNDNVNLHLIGKLQSNKAKEAFDLFKFIHTLDNEKLAKKFSELEKYGDKKLKYFIQVNVGEEIQKNGIAMASLKDFVNFCKNDMKLNVIGLMCIPPINLDPEPFFKKMQDLNIKNNLLELSMGMSSDYKNALVNGSTFARVGSSIFS